MKKFLLLPFITFFFSCNSPQIESYDLLIINASIIDVKSGEIASDKMIGIRNDKIQLIAEMSDLDSYKANEVLDANHHFVMPGLWDMHVHFRGGEPLITENKALLSMYLDYGVTTIRDAGGDITPSVQEWIESIDKNELKGPTIFTSGPKLDGAEPSWAGSIPITTIDEVGPALDSLEKIGVDYVKTYDGSLSEEVYYEIIKEAEARNLKITGHMPLTANLLKAIDLGLDGSEHLYYALKAASPVGDSLGKLNLGYRMMRQLLDTYDSNLANESFQKMANNDFYVTPTLHIVKILNDLVEVDHTQDSLYQKMGAGIRETYKGREEGRKNATPETRQLYKELEIQFRAMVKPMYDAKVNILAGSDTGPYNSYVYPGESLHQELARLVEAGLTPQEALICSMINGPKFFNLQDKYGSIEKGKMADLLILEKNPLENINHTRSIQHTIKAGQIYNQ